MNYLTDAGPAIWLVLAAGLAALVAAVQYARTRAAHHRSLAVGATTVSIVFALLGAMTGFQRSVGGLREVAADDRWIYLWGVSESLNNLVVALTLAVVVCLLLTAGAWRRETAAGH